MEDPTAESKDYSGLAGETLVITDPAKVVVFNGHYLAVEEIAFARNVRYGDARNIQVAGDGLIGPEDGCIIEFRRKGSLFVPGLTVEGLGALVSGDPY